MCPSECQQSASGGAVVCLLQGRGEGERDRATEGREGENRREREGEGGQERKLFTSEEPQRKRVRVCVLERRPCR